MQREQELGAIARSIIDSNLYVAQLQAPALHRLYRAIVTQHSILDPGGHPVHRHKIDHRTPVVLRT